MLVNSLHNLTVQPVVCMENKVSLLSLLVSYTTLYSYFGWTLALILLKFKFSELLQGTLLHHQPAIRLPFKEPCVKCYI